MKTGRQEKIMELIGKYEIETQEELAEHLKKEGFDVTQATVSRDIRKLKLTKIAADGGKQKYAPEQPQSTEESRRYLRVLKEGFVSMEMAQNILVVKTVSGMAMAVAAAIDAMHWQEVAGCIAGDDTILCANRSSEDTLAVMGKIRRIVDEEM
ncbi:MAG: arginine repressor [Clostridiales bacterium]|nr:arginine repressor [Clostridiales bacterium]